MSTVERPGRADTRARIVDAAARLLQEEGPAAMTTRRVADAAGVQAPTIYRLFGDKDGLLEAVAEHVLSTFVSAKEDSIAGELARGADPVDDLRQSWNTQIDFALANPSVYAIFTDPTRDSPAFRAGSEVLRARVDRVAAAGRLRVSTERAIALIRSGGTGVILNLLRTPIDERDAGLPAEMWSAVLAQILTDPPERPDDEFGRGVDAVEHVLSDAERMLLAEWRSRVTGAGT